MIKLNKFSNKKLIEAFEIISEESVNPDLITPRGKLTARNIRQGNVIVSVDADTY